MQEWNFIMTNTNQREKVPLRGAIHDTSSLQSLNFQSLSLKSLSFQSLSCPCNHSYTQGVIKPENGYPGPMREKKKKKFGTLSLIPQTISQYRVNAATMASSMMEGLIDSLAAMLWSCVTKPGPMIYQFLACSPNLSPETRTETKRGRKINKKLTPST